MLWFRGHFHPASAAVGHKKQLAVMLAALSLLLLPATVGAGSHPPVAQCGDFVAVCQPMTGSSGSTTATLQVSCGAFV